MRSIRYLFPLILLVGVAEAQPTTQIRSREAMSMRVPIIGKIEMVTTKFVADGMIHEKEETKVDRFIFRWMGGSEGSITDISRGYRLYYDDDDEEQWQTTFEDLVEKVTNPDTTKQRSISFTVGGADEDESDEEPVVSRTEEGVEDVNGISARKWVTTVLGNDSRAIFEMWMAEDQPEKERATEIEKKIDEKIGLPVSEDGVSGFAQGLASIDEAGLEPIPGIMIKMNMIAFEDDDEDPKMSASVELLEIKKEPFDPSDFAIPESYKLVEKE